MQNENQVRLRKPVSEERKQSEPDYKQLRGCLKQSSIVKSQGTPRSGSNPRFPGVASSHKISSRLIIMDEVIQGGAIDGSVDRQVQNSKEEERNRKDRQGQIIAPGEQYSISFKLPHKPLNQMSVSEKIKFQRQGSIEFAKPKQKKEKQEKQEKRTIEKVAKENFDSNLATPLGDLCLERKDRGRSRPPISNKIIETQSIQNQQITILVSEDPNYNPQTSKNKSQCCTIF